MPYIEEHDRESVVPGNDLTEPGYFAYSLSQKIQDFLVQFTKGGKWRFWHMALVTGVLVLTILEFWRKVVCPYEDKKEKDHGTVWWT